MDQLVPDRDCGACNLCCIVPAIDKPEIQKVPGSVCRHCLGGPCDIYETRPAVCHAYYCGWRRLELFSDEWRPDRSGVLVDLELRGTATALNLTLVANPLKTLREPRFIDFVADRVARNLPTFLGLPGPKGRTGAKLMLNNPEIRAAARQSRGAVKALLEKALKMLQAHDFQPAVNEFHGHDVST